MDMDTEALIDCKTPAPFALFVPHMHALVSYIFLNWKKFINDAEQNKAYNKRKRIYVAECISSSFTAFSHTLVWSNALCMPLYYNFKAKRLICIHGIVALEEISHMEVSKIIFIYLAILLKTCRWKLCTKRRH